MIITKFDSLYAGHVNMQDVGYGGTAVNDRVFGNAHLAGATEQLEWFAAEVIPAFRGASMRRRQAGTRRRGMTKND